MVAAVMLRAVVPLASAGLVFTVDDVALPDGSEIVLNPYDVIGFGLELGEGHTISCYDLGYTLTNSGAEFIITGGYGYDLITFPTLFDFPGYVRREASLKKCYIFFQSTILTIAKDHPKWSLRQIDRALFAYHKNHKKYLGLKIKGREGNAKRCS
jgi:hypothetical protein